MDEERAIRPEYIMKLQRLIRREQGISIPLSAVEAEYALYRTDSKVFSAVYGFLNGNEPDDGFEAGGVSLKEVKEKYDTDTFGSLCLMAGEIAGTQHSDQLAPLTRRIAAEESITEKAALVAAVCILNGMNPALREGVEMYATGTLREDYASGEDSLQSIKNALGVSDLCALAAMNIAEDHSEYFYESVWKLNYDAVDYSDKVSTETEV